MCTDRRLCADEMERNVFSILECNNNQDSVEFIASDTLV